MQEVWDAAPCDNQLNHLLYYDWQYTLADNDLRKVETMAGARRACAFRTRCCTRTSSTSRCACRRQMKMPGTQLRHFYKEAMAGFLPDEIIHKKKHGFGLPFGLWLHDSPRLRDLVMGSLSDLRRREIVQPAFLDRLLQLHGAEDASYHGVFVWVLAMLEQWFQEHGIDTMIEPSRSAAVVRCCGTAGALLSGAGPRLAAGADLPPRAARPAIRCCRTSRMQPPSPGRSTCSGRTFSVLPLGEAVDRLVRGDAAVACGLHHLRRRLRQQLRSSPCRSWRSAACQPRCSWRPGFSRRRADVQRHGDRGRAPGARRTRSRRPRARSPRAAGRRRAGAGHRADPAGAEVPRPGRTRWRDAATIADRVGARAAGRPDDDRRRRCGELHRHGIEIGAHTVNHPILAQADDDTARREIVASKRPPGRDDRRNGHVVCLPERRSGSRLHRSRRRPRPQAGFDLAVSTAWGAAPAAARRNADSTDRAVGPHQHFASACAWCALTASGPAVA